MPRQVFRMQYDIDGQAKDVYVDVESFPDLGSYESAIKNYEAENGGKFLTTQFESVSSENLTTPYPPGVDIISYKGPGSKPTEPKPKKKREGKKGRGRK